MSRFGEYDIRWDVDGWLPEQTVAMMVAPPGSYKTWLELDLAVSVATNTPFLGHFPVRNAGPVVIVQQEDFHGQMAERIGTIINSRFPAHYRIKHGVYSGRMPLDPPIYLHPDRQFRFDDKDIVEGLYHKINLIRPRLVVIDPLYSTGDTDDYLTKAVHYMFALKDMRDEFGCSFLLAHHTAKHKGEGTERESSWGSQFLNAFLETGWQIRRQPRPNSIVVRRHFKVSQDAEEITLDIDISTKYPTHYNINIRDATVVPAVSPEGGDIMSIFSGGGSYTAIQVADAMKIHRTTAARKLDKLVLADVLIRTGDGAYTLPSNIVGG
jgi:hypothetical protein